jgi:integrase
VKVDAWVAETRRAVHEHRTEEAGTRFAVSATFLRRVESSGIDRITLQGLRHTWATLALEKGIHPRVVQERLGHSTIAITLGIYSHVTPTLHDEAAELISQLVMTP